MSDNINFKLEEIETQWSLVRQAHHASDTDSTNAKKRLVMRYSASIRRFVRFLTRDEVDADDIAQEAILRLMRGDFEGADPDQGRFRDFLRTALRNMVRNHWAKQARTSKLEQKLMDESVGCSLEESELDDDWIACWRTNILDNAWEQLRAFESENENSRPHTLLRVRVDHPDWSYEQVSEYLATIGIEMSQPAIRQQIHRARSRFAKNVIDEVVYGLDVISVETVQNELIALGIFEHVKDDLPEEWRLNEGR